MDSVFYDRVGDIDEAVRLAQQPGTRFIGGGTNLLDLMKGDVEHAVRLVDITRLPLAGITESPDGGLRLGALARNADTANHPLVRERYPMLARAILSGASPQLRNMATNGGNLLQRTRCPYFYDTGFDMCNKRKPGSGCGALDGYNRMHAVLGASRDCVAVNPSDMSVALAALDASVRVRGPRGERSIAFADFHRLPGDAPDRDNNLQVGELIVAIDLPRSPYAAHSIYLKVRDRASYAFALVSVAAAVEMRDGAVQSARIALGGVAHKPWRSEAAEAALAGRTLDDASLRNAADAAVTGAVGLRHNAFKIELARRAVRRALSIAGAQA
jgi:xanthine dehydrogenase YagS FAD-binding subunit